MDDERRKYPRMPSMGVTKHSYIVEKKGDKENLVEVEVLDVSKEGIRARINIETEFRYSIFEGQDVLVKVIFNNNLTVKLDGKVMWYKDSPEEGLEFGLHFAEVIL